MNTEKKAKKPKGVLVASSTWPMDRYCDYFTHIHEEIEYDIERDGVMDEKVVFDRFEPAINARHQDITPLPFDEGRGEKLREIIRNEKNSFVGFRIKGKKNLLPVNIPLLCELALARGQRKGVMC